MGQKQSARVGKMMENFLRLHNEGKEISEIAEMFQLSSRTVYLKLQEIADKEGITREELLSRPHKKHVVTKERKVVKSIDICELKKGFEDLQKDIDEILVNIDEAIAE